MGQGNNKARFWAAAAVPLILGLSAAVNADDAAAKPADPPSLKLDTAFRPAAKDISLEAFLRQPVEANQPVRDYGEYDLKTEIKESIADQIISRFNLTRLEYDSHYQGAGYNLFRKQVDNSWFGSLDMRWQFMFALDGNGRTPAPPSSGNLYKNDSPNTIGFRVVFSPMPDKR